MRRSVNSAHMRVSMMRAMCSDAHSDGTCLSIRQLGIDRRRRYASVLHRALVTTRWSRFAHPVLQRLCFPGAGPNSKMKNVAPIMTEFAVDFLSNSRVVRRCQSRGAAALKSFADLQRASAPTLLSISTALTQ